MKKIIALAAILAASPAAAQVSIDSGQSYTSNGTTYYQDSRVGSGQSYDAGGITYYQDSQGRSGQSYNSNGITYYQGHNPAR